MPDKGKKQERTFLTAAMVCASPISALPPGAPPPYVDNGPFIFAMYWCFFQGYLEDAISRKKVDFLPPLPAFDEAEKKWVWATKKPAVLQHH